MPDHTLVAGSPPEARLAFETLIESDCAPLGAAVTVAYIAPRDALAADAGRA